METRTSEAVRGRRKQAKPQRKVELDALNNENPTNSSETKDEPSQMSPDTNHNEILKTEEVQKCYIVGKQDEIRNGLSMHTKIEKTGGSAADQTNELISAKAAVGEQLDDDEKIKEYLQRSDTAVIYPEPVGHLENVSSPMSNGIKEEEFGSTSDYYIKCPQCQMGCQTFQSLKEHMETNHSDLAENGGLSTMGAVSPTPSLGPFGCAQCTASFTSKDQLEKHELLHSPNAQVCCKICNKSFANVYRLQRHMISHDESAVLRKFKCTECDKAFKFKHHLKEHIRIHSGEKPFECPNCGKRFSHSGSYSSHMTSKKCLVMNLKLGRNRTPSGSSSTSNLLDKNQASNRNNLKRNNLSPINNNLTTSPNHNSYLPILPKYSEAAAAFLQSSLAASNSPMSPFYLAPPSLLNSAHSISPYSLPNLGHIFEQLHQAQHQHTKAPSSSCSSPMRPFDSTESIHHEVDKDVKQESKEVPNSNNVTTSECGDLIMDEDLDDNQLDEPHNDKNNKNEQKQHGANNGDLEAVKRILETVNATVTKQLLQANMQKFSSESSSDCPSISSVHSSKQNDLFCEFCKKIFESNQQLDEHDCDKLSTSEGLAAKLEDIATVKSEDTHNGSVSGEEQDSYDKHHSDRGNYDEIDCESVTTTEDGRKVRVRSLISDEQLKVLKDNYKLNPRPKREDLEKIAETIGFPVRVVQVWFQNTRARDRREGRLIQVPYSPAPIRYQSLLPKMLPNIQSPTHYNSEQPLDLSTKKILTSTESSPQSSPRPTSANNLYNGENGDEVVNLSRKFLTSPNSYIYPNHYQGSNSSETRQTPSPIDFTNSSRLAQILAQPAHKLGLPGMNLVPMEQLMQLSATDLPSLSQLITNRLNSLSPISKKQNGERREHDLPFHEEDLVAAGGVNKRSKMSQFVLKTLGSPMLSGTDQEQEGQFTCDQCDKAFSKQSSLARHKYEHSGQRPHKCDECPKAFKHKHHLTEHKRLHSGEKPFQCIKCLKRFSHSGSYSQHMNHRYSYCKPYRE